MNPMRITYHNGRSGSAKHNDRNFDLNKAEHTKDERLNPHNGRYIPISEKCAQVLSYATEIPGKSDYVFHDPGNTEMVSKDSYVKNLSKRCKRVGTAATNNHAFRIAFNSRLIELGFSASDRALILGHEVQSLKLPIFARP